MKQESKYHPLYHYLTQSDQDELMLTFSEIEAIIGQPLPASARTQRGWWSNRRKGALQSSAWMSAGYHAEVLDLENEAITFRKPLRMYTLKRRGDTVLWDGKLVKALRTYLEMNQSELARELGMRQQTISDWETGLYEPKLSTSKYLSMFAERAGFKYLDKD